MRWRLVAVSRKAGHRFGLPRIIHSGGAWDGLEHDIKLDARGGGTIAWARGPQEAFRDTGILVSTRRPGRRFTRPRLVDAHAATPQLAANRAGDTVLVWRRFVPPDDGRLSVLGRAAVMVAAIRPAGAARFDAAQALSGPPDRPGMPAVAIAPDGTALVAWDSAEGVEAAVRPPRGHFGGPTRFPPPSSNGYQAVDVTGRAAGVVAWTTDAAVFASRWNGQAFSQAIAVTEGSTIPREPRVLLARDGRATVEWHAGPFDPCRPTTPRYASTLPGSGPPDVPVTISPANGTQGQFASALDDDGRLVRAWLQATSIGGDKYGISCWFPTMRVAASIDGGAAVHGPEVELHAQVAFAEDPVRTPMLVWSARGRVRMSTLRGASP